MLFSTNTKASSKHAAHKKEEREEQLVKLELMKCIVISGFSAQC